MQYSQLDIQTPRNENQDQKEDDPLQELNVPKSQGNNSQQKQLNVQIEMTNTSNINLQKKERDQDEELGSYDEYDEDNDKRIQRQNQNQRQKSKQQRKVGQVQNDEQEYKVGGEQQQQEEDEDQNQQESREQLGGIFNNQNYWKIACQLITVFTFIVIFVYIILIVIPEKKKNYGKNLPDLTDQTVTELGSDVIHQRCPSKKYQVGRYCVDLCPKGFYQYQTETEGNYCQVNCPQQTFVSESKKSCLKKCPEEEKFLEFERFCTKQCFEDNFLLNEIFCVSKCPDNYLIDEKQRCVDKCGKEQLTDSAHKKCYYQNCPQEKFIFNRTCVSNCPQGTYIGLNGTCTENCQSENLGSLDSLGQIIYTDITTQKCVTQCQQFVYLNKCLERCPKDTELISHKNYSECKSTSIQPISTSYQQSSSIYQEPDEYKSSSSSENQNQSSESAEVITSEVQDQPKSSEIQSSQKDQKPFNFEFQSVSECPVNTYLLQNQQCVGVCPSGTQPMEVQKSNLCAECGYSMNPYSKYEIICQQCGANQHVCLECKKSFNNSGGKCMSNCPKNSKFVTDSQICIRNYLPTNQVEFHHLKLQSDKYLLGEIVEILVVEPKIKSESENLYSVYYLHDFNSSFSSLGTIETNITQFSLENQALVISFEGKDSFFVNSDTVKNYQYQSFFCEELVPFITTQFQLSDKREKRAIIGQGMGGFGALNISIHSCANIFGQSVILNGFINLNQIEDKELVQRVFGPDFDLRDKNIKQLKQAVYSSFIYVVPTIQTPESVQIELRDYCRELNRIKYFGEYNHIKCMFLEHKKENYNNLEEKFSNQYDSVVFPFILSGFDEFNKSQ